MAARVEQQRTETGRWAQPHKANRVGGDRASNNAALGAGLDACACVRLGLMIDETAVSAEHHGGIDVITPPDGRDKVANGWHRPSGKCFRSVRSGVGKSSMYRLLRHPSYR